MGRHGTISSFVGIIIRIIVIGFGVSFELFDDAVGIFGVIFSGPCINTNGVCAGDRNLSLQCEEPAYPYPKRGGYLYDKQGNLLEEQGKANRKKYSYDAANRQVSVASAEADDAT